MPHNYLFEEIYMFIIFREQICAVRGKNSERMTEVRRRSQTSPKNVADMRWRSVRGRFGTFVKTVLSLLHGGDMGLWSGWGN